VDDHGRRHGRQPEQRQRHGLGFRLRRNRLEKL
jgi:hypothetical protein